LIFIQLEDPIHFANFYLYYSKLPAVQRISVTSAGTAWIDPNTGQPYLLILNEFLFFGDHLNHTLLCPNQLHSNGLMVHDTPLMFDQNGTHSIYDPVSDIRIPMDLKGVVSYFDSSNPTLEESMDMPVIVLTSSIIWEQTAADLPNQEWILKIFLHSQLKC
jgi:hypothetical protein